MASDEQPEHLGPLRGLANAVDTVGRSSAAAIYSGIALDVDAGCVDVYLTDLGQAKTVLDAARMLDGTIDTGLARFRQGRHTKAEMCQARDRVFRARRELGIESIAVPVDGGALKVRVADVEAAREAAGQPTATGRSTAAEAGVELAFEPAVEGSDMSRLADTPPWVAGAALTDRAWNSAAEPWMCTSGVPTRRTSDDRPFLITAAHCFRNGHSIYSGWYRDSSGAYVRNYIGRIAARAGLLDAVAVDTSGTGVTAGWEWDGPRQSSFLLELTSSAYSFQGDYVSHDGYTSGVVGRIEVVAPDVYWTGTDGVLHRGVEGRRKGGEAIREGDSGSLVFGVTDGTRQARGISSWGGGGAIRWTEVVDIYRHWGLRLAPP
ncbi:S1 family peptidase [Yinghuangia soli]|uniref:S1 family peptidase n=1 Tax=Yinghuangia soli TaxID=2908204 RepID=A0AA41Q286_9ACTN|nr:S1 family peptidase [Yinghuangia soli]MCF2529595.1 S1 family peptidase [Yinghuangia soli]